MFILAVAWCTRARSEVLLIGPVKGTGVSTHTFLVRTKKITTVYRLEARHEIRNLRAEDNLLNIWVEIRHVYHPH